MNLSIVKTIFLKEMLDTFRDKRTMIAMVGLPIILYPVLFITAAQVSILQQTKTNETVSRAAIQGSTTERMTTWIADLEQVDQVDNPEARAALDAGDLDAILIVTDDFEDILASDGSAPLKILYDATEGPSREAQRRLVDGLVDLRKELLTERLLTEDLETTFALPLDITTDNIAPPSKSTGSILGMILPLIMVVMLGIGAFYPAVDLTAGEKERGTFETLLSTPTSKLEIIAGKFLTVFALSMFTGLLNLASMVITLMFQLNQLLAQQPDNGDFILGWIEIPPSSILAMGIVLIPMAFFISAVMMTVALLARSFKEAQNYVSPVFIAILLPASAVSIPGIELNNATQFIPIANVSLLFRDLLTGKASLDMFFVVFICTAIYAMLALVIAAWMFQREDVILSEDSGVPLTLNRNLFTPASTPTLGTALGIFAVVMMLIFYAGSYAQGRDLHSGLLITQYLIILLPVVGILWFIKVNIKEALNLRRAPGGAWLGTALMAPAWLLIILQIGVYHNRILPAPKEFAALSADLFTIGDGGPLAVLALLFIIGVSPAICEEVLFRGVLVSGLRKRMPSWAVILTVGLLFGLFHLSVHKVVTTGLSGVFFTYLAVCTGSIFLPMLAHFTLNGLAVLIEMGYIPTFVINYLENNAIEEQGLPLWVVAAAVVVFIVGAIFLEQSVRRKQAT